MSEQLTEISEFDRPCEGYIVIAPLPEYAKQQIALIQARFVQEFGEESLWLPTDDQLHITVAHILTPGVEYPEKPKNIFQRIGHLASAALHETIANFKPFSIKTEFNTIQAFPSAVILKASDDGSLDRLRKEFTEKFDLPEGTRTPPNIIHTTLMRFRKPVDFEKVQRLVEELQRELKIIEVAIESLQMIREDKIFVQEHEVLEEFPPKND